MYENFLKEALFVDKPTEKEMLGIISDLSSEESELLKEHYLKRLAKFFLEKPYEKKIASNEIEFLNLFSNVGDKDAPLNERLVYSKQYYAFSTDSYCIAVAQNIRGRDLKKGTFYKNRFIVPYMMDEMKVPLNVIKEYGMLEYSDGFKPLALDEFEVIELVNRRDEKILGYKIDGISFCKTRLDLFKLNSFDTEYKVVKDKHVEAIFLKARFQDFIVKLVLAKQDTID